MLLLVPRQPPIGVHIRRVPDSTSYAESSNDDANDDTYNLDDDGIDAADDIDDAKCRTAKASAKLSKNASS